MSREAFEAHIARLAGPEFIAKDATGYVSPMTRGAWIGWQAAIQHACDVAAEIVLRELDDNGQARAINDAIKEALK